ncbi:MAG: serine--tRNA ligase, partial [Oscillospiraceae bacterium]|nr:serine--tRNA ligase [Oscillospiraceae bacterium]
MIDINFLKKNPDAVKENIRKKFQDHKLPLVDEVIELDVKRREYIQETESLKSQRNKISKENGMLFGRMKKSSDEAEKAEIQKQIDENTATVTSFADKMAALDADLAKVDARIREIMLTIPNIIDPEVPLGPDDSHNVEVQRYGEPVVPEFEVPYHTDIMAKFSGIDLDSARRVAGNGFYYLMGDIARIHSSVISYARDFMIERGFTYCVPPFMIR